MRQRSENTEVSVKAIAGTRVVLLGLNASEKAAERLLGFGSYRKEAGSKYKLLRGGRMFPGVHSEEAAAQESPDSCDAPIQAFLWGDYVVEPNRTYTYKLQPVYGTPAALEYGDAVEVTVRTEDPAGEDSKHSVYFNRGVAGSQAYSRKFGKFLRWYGVHGRDEDGNPAIAPRCYIKPEDVPNRKAYEWLSRGLEEAMLSFIAEAKDSTWAIRAAAYELSHEPVIQAFVDAVERGVDVRIVHHAKPAPVYRVKRNDDAEIAVTYAQGKGESFTLAKKELVHDTSPRDGICTTARGCVARLGVLNREMFPAFAAMMTERTITQISHNKFIVLLKDGKPLAVWTGSTNFTAGGIFGQSNVGHVVRDPAVAAKYQDYWKMLSTDPKKKSSGSTVGMANWTVEQQPDLDGPPPRSTTPVFSPRQTKGMLDWYADRLAAAKRAVFFTAAFSVADEIYEKALEVRKTKKTQPYLRYLLLESNGGLLYKKCRELAKCPQNRIAWGDVLQAPDAGEEREQFIETLTGLNDHVEYLHTKYMLIDPLSNDPIVITGSANFSKPSTVDNDENMLIIRGDTRVADIYLGEFMRLFNHYGWRNHYNRLSDEDKANTSFLHTDASWTIPYYTPGTQEFSERLLFNAD
jgi:phosphatidylserine/phosphatidylglycerophosphate/cardiolipin synthase-like enzyme